jgi:hypothetical protein
MVTAHRYTGILGKRRKPLAKAADPNVAAALQLLYDLETENLLAALFADCGAPYHKSAHAPRGGLVAASLDASQVSAWQHVALTLAKRHVKGFQVAKRKRGRPRRSDHFEIIADMSRELRANKKSIREAAKSVATRRRFPQSAADAIDQLYRRQMKMIGG